MASGNTLLVLTPLANQPPASAYATLDTRNGHVVLDFDAAADESALFGAVLPRNYAGGGITVSIYWMATTATSGTCRWEVMFERHLAGTTDLDADDFAASQSAGGTANATSGIITVTTITFTDGSQMDSLAVGESFRLRLRRDADGTTGTDDMTGDAEALRIELKET